MSLDKAIEHGKEHRKPYRGAKAVDKNLPQPWGRPVDGAGEKVQNQEERTFGG